MAGEEEDENPFDGFTRRFSENPEIVKESPAYHIIVPRFIIPLMAKLVATALAGPTQESRNNAAIVITEMVKTDHIRNAYLHILHETLNSFRVCALLLMLTNQPGSDLQHCGQVLTAELLNSSLEHNETDDWSWTDLLGMSEFGLTQQQFLEFFLDLICELRDENMEKFVRFLEPYIIVANHDRFIEALMNLLRRGDFDCSRVYITIPNLYHFVREEIYRGLLREAIHSPFFENVRDDADHEVRACVANSLRKSIDKTPRTFVFPIDWAYSAGDIVDSLFDHARTDMEWNAAMALHRCFMRKFA